MFTVKRHVVVTVHGREPPTDTEWAGYLKTCRSLLARVHGNLIFTDGGGPNAQQRAMLACEYPEFGPIPTALVTDSPLARGMVTALSWLGRDIRAFALKDLDSAFSYLKVPQPDQAVLLRCVAGLRTKLLGVELESLSDDATTIASLTDFVAKQRLDRVMAKLDLLAPPRSR